MTKSVADTQSVKKNLEAKVSAYFGVSLQDANIALYT